MPFIFDANFHCWKYRYIIYNISISIIDKVFKVITCELAMRFRTDYIDGDLYFKVRSPEHNLIRARAQMKLLTDIEKKSEEMDKVIEELLK